VVKKPTSLKLHEFPDETFIHGCYLEEKICEDLISYYELNTGRHHTGQMYGTCDEHRNTLVSNEKRKKSTDIYFDLDNIQDRLVLNNYIDGLNKCIAEYEYKFKQAYEMESYGVKEIINMQKYKPSEGFYHWHCERNGLATQSRCLAFMTYLNTVPAGGTEFMYQKLIVPAIQGLTIIWPSDWTHTHRGQITKEHEKYVLTGWLNYQS